MKAVLDTNVIVSALNFPGSEEQVVALASKRAFELILSEFILIELHRALTQKFHWSYSSATKAVDELRAIALIVDPPHSVEVIVGDHPDNRVLECAVHASADYLVTGDRKHLLPLETFEDVRILRAPDFIDILRDA